MSILVLWSDHPWLGFKVGIKVGCWPQVEFIRSAGLAWGIACLKQCHPVSLAIHLARRPLVVRS